MPQTTKFLDGSGLTLYDQNIKDYIDSIIENDIAPAIDAKAEDAVFGASGSNHSTGLVPDPGATSGTTKFLREDGTWAVPAGGSGGGGGGDVNVIESISVNNVAQTVDANKNVNITVPVVTTATAIADGDTGYSTGDQVYDYVQANKGDTNLIESISVNGSAQTITNKNVDITVPVIDVQTSTNGSTYTTVVDANKVAKIDLSGYAETSDIPEPAQAMADGDMGYVTGDMLYDIVGDLVTFLENY